MKHPISLSFFALLSIVAVSITGCGSGDTEGGGGAGLTPGTAAVFGLAVLENEPVEGASISVILNDGTEVPLAETSTTDHGGAFAAKLSPSIPSGAFTVAATAPNGEMFDTEVEVIENGGSVFVHINGLTTLCRVYHMKHPELSIAEVRSKVHRYVGIPVQSDLGDHVAHPYYSRFSLQLFMTKARQHPGGFAAYLEIVAQNIDSPSLPATGASDDYNTSDFADTISPEWQNGVSKMASPTTTVEKAAADAFSLASATGDGLIDNIIGLIIDHIPGLGSDSTLTAIQDQLNKIQNQLSKITSMITGLSTTIQQDFNQSEYTDISTNLTAPSEYITGAYEQIQQIQMDALPADNPNTTALTTDVPTLYEGWKNTRINDDANKIHINQSQGTPGNQPLLYYAKQLTYTDSFLGDSNWDSLQGQMNYYAGLQVEAINILAALNSPSTYSIIDGTTPGGLRLLASDWISEISGNIQQEMMQLPLPPVTQNQFADITKDAAMLYQNASVFMKTGGTAWNYATSLTDGGLNWVVASSPGIQDVFNLVKSIPGGTQQTISEWMNTNLGTNLKPGPVTYDLYGSSMSSDWVKLKTVTATESGFLTIIYTGTYACGAGTCYGYTIGWIDDNGNSGTIGTTGTYGPDYIAMLATNLDTDNDTVFVPGNSGDCAVHINGPCIIIVNKDNTFTQSHSAVVLGAYDGLKISSSGEFICDPYSQFSSGTQALTVYPTQNSNELSFELTDYVYWTSSDSQNAPISNVQSSSGSNPTGNPTFPPLPNNAGTIHWLPGSFGKTVTFTATRQLPNGANIQGSFTLPSPVSGSTPIPQAVSVWPSRYNVIASNWDTFVNNGLQLYPTRYYGSGNCEDVRSNVTYTLPQGVTGYTISPQGFVETSLEDLPPAGTSLVITVTDPAIPQQSSEGNVRQTDTCTITFN